MHLIAALEDLWEQLLASRREVSSLIFHSDKQTLTRLNSARWRLLEIIWAKSLTGVIFISVKAADEPLLDSEIKRSSGYVGGRACNCWACLGCLTSTAKVPESKSRAGCVLRQRFSLDKVPAPGCGVGIAAVWHSRASPETEDVLPRSAVLNWPETLLLKT